jgi:hypothetical protein
MASLREGTYTRQEGSAVCTRSTQRAELNQGSIIIENDGPVWEWKVHNGAAERKGDTGMSIVAVDEPATLCSACRWVGEQAEGVLCTCARPQRRARRFATTASAQHL